MSFPAKFIVVAAFGFGAMALAPNASVAMPIANVGLDTAPLTEEAHAVRVCNRGRCWWTHAGHYHGRYGYMARPYYWHGRGYHYGWRHPYGWHGGRYGYGWRGHGHWR
jgi:hypothetical protein